MKTIWLEKRIISALVIISFLSITMMFYFRVSKIKREKSRAIPDDYYIYPVNDNNGGESDDDDLESFVKETLNVKILRNIIASYNGRKVIRNQPSGFKVMNTTPVIVIDVHKNVAHVMRLVESLENMSGINNTLLIFCHEYYIKQINTFIQGIKFAMVMQIFFPYSIQVYKHHFPGPDPYYCLDDINCVSLTMKERNINKTQSKHFWWWKANEVFDYTTALKYYHGFIVFLEDTDVVTKDFIFTLRLLQVTATEKCPQCRLLSLNAQTPFLVQNFKKTPMAYIDFFRQEVFKSGLAFNRSVWKEIKYFANQFCYFNDYNWDQSLVNVGTQTESRNFPVLYIEAPRVQNAWKQHNKTETTMRNIEKYLFPKSLQVNTKHMEEMPFAVENGLWNDVRDQELCMFMSVFYIK